MSMSNENAVSNVFAVCGEKKSSFDYLGRGYKAGCNTNPIAYDILANPHKYEWFDRVCAEREKLLSIYGHLLSERVRCEARGLVHQCSRTNPNYGKKFLVWILMHNAFMPYEGSYRERCEKILAVIKEHNPEWEAEFVADYESKVGIRK